MVEPSNERPLERFGGLAADYDRYRPDYSPEALDYVMSHCGLAAKSRMVDIGCGTGISSRAFAARGLEVIGVEPNADMRRKAESVPCPGGSAPTYRDGQAEATGLPDAWVDAVISAQAFHWFVAAAALPEAMRILKQGGWLILMWNEPNRNDPLTAQYMQLLVNCSPEPAIADHIHSDCGAVLLTRPGFEAAERVEFTHLQSLDRAGLRGRALSASYAPKEATTRERLCQALDTLFNLHQQAGTVNLLYRTPVYVARKPV